jgi:hypothetical protein
MEYCKDDEDKLTQMAPHISGYLDRAGAIEEIRKKDTSTTSSSTTTTTTTSGAAEEGHDFIGPEVDKQAQKQLEDMGLTAQRAQDALKRFDNDVERAISWHFENPEPEPEPSPPQKPSSIPAAASKPPPNPSTNPFSQTNMQRKNNQNPAPAPPAVSRSRRSLSPARIAIPENTSHAACPEFRKFNPPSAPSPVARPPARPPRSSSPPRQAPRPPTLPPGPSTPQSSLAPLQNPSQLTPSSLVEVMELMKQAAVSEVATCRCVMFSDERGVKCGMPAALVTSEESNEPIAGDLCWSCKYIEAVSGQDALISSEDGQAALENDDSDDDEEENGALSSPNEKELVQKSNTSSSQVAESSLSNNTASIVLPVPAPPPKQEKPRGWFDSWFGSSYEPKETLSKEERQNLENEFVKLKAKKNKTGLTDAQKQKMRSVRRSLRTNEVIEIENANHVVVSSPTTTRRQSLEKASSNGQRRKSSQNKKIESDEDKILRLKQILRKARVSDTMKCQCDLYSVKSGEVCSRPAALSIDPVTQQATPTTMCWQCKRIDAYSM